MIRHLFTHSGSASLIKSWLLKKLGIFPPYMDTQLSQHHLLKTFLSPLDCFSIFVKNQMIVFIRICFPVICFLHWSIFSILLLVSHYLDYYNFTVNFKTTIPFWVRRSLLNTQNIADLQYSCCISRVRWFSKYKIVKEFVNTLKWSWILLIRMTAIDVWESVTNAWVKTSHEDSRAQRWSCGSQVSLSRRKLLLGSLVAMISGENSKGMDSFYQKCNQFASSDLSGMRFPPELSKVHRRRKGTIWNLVFPETLVWIS